MPGPHTCSRRSFLALAAAAPALSRARAAARIPAGLELYSVRNDLKKDLMGTVRRVARLGYDCVEFYAPYYDWEPAFARKVREELDQLHVRCYSTHNDLRSFTPEGIGKAMELNRILGSGVVVLASPGDIESIDGWKRVADTLNAASRTLAAGNMRAGYHNHDLEWKPVGGQQPMELLASNTDPSVVLQLDVGTCLETGNDPVAWINRNPGRIRSMHCKDWSPEKGYRVLFGEGAAPWKQIFAAAESTGGIEYYLVEQEGSDYSELETAKRCLKTFRAIHG